MQAFTIVVRIVELDILRGRRSAEVVDIHVPLPVHLCAKAAKHRVIGMTGVASFPGRDAMILEVRGGQMARVIDQQAFAERFHFVARQTKLGLFGMFDVIRSAHSQADYRQQKQQKKRKYFTRRRAGNGRTQD